MKNRIKALLIFLCSFYNQKIQAAGIICQISEIHYHSFTLFMSVFFVLFILLSKRIKKQNRIISEQKKEIDSAKIISDAVFGNIYSYILLVDQNLIVQRTNYYTLSSTDDSEEKKDIGELLMCVNALSAGCGKSKACPDCPIRKAIIAAFKEKKDFSNLSITLNLLISENQVTQIEALISGAYLILEKEKYLLLTVFDTTHQNKVKEKIAEKHAQFSVTFNTLPVAIAICNRDGVVHEVNDYYLELMGTEKEGLIQRVNVFNNPCLPDTIKNQIKQGEYISEEVSYDFQKLNRTGYFKSIYSNKQYYKFTVDYVKTGNGQIEKLILIWVNNTLVHNTLKQNKNIMDMFRFVSTASKIGFSSINLLKEDTIVTPEYFINLGENKTTNIKNIINKYSNIHPDDREYLLSFSERVSHEKIPDITFDKDIRVSDRSGGWRWIRQVLIQKTFDPKNKNIEILGMNIDITRQKEIEEKLKRAQQQAENSDKQKSVFLSNMSHEIRTPLNAIIGFSRLLAETETEENEKQSYIDIINNNNQLLLQLISDILDLSKIEANTLEFNYSNVNINTLLKDIEQTTRMKAGEKNPVKIIFEPESPHCYIYTERNRLSQIINNLLTNALKFTEEGCIRFGYKRQESGIYFYISDTGKGIPEEKQKQMFERFVKLDKFKSGTGLGLAICKSIITKLGGEIGVNSKPGKGSTFWFTLPANAIYFSEKDKQNDTSRTSDKNSTIDKQENTLNIPKHTLLIAEDIEDNYRLYEVLLNKKYNLLHAWNGQEAVDLFTKHRPDAILMDIRMPVLDGYEATKAIREIEQDIPIIGVTAFAFSEDKEKILSSGFNMCITKPIVSKNLMEALSAVNV
ncbi:ATP-binding protein [uncultured Coprobacter sp.]|jgi:two-component system sensor histidine kinase|uniref:ATP-binding protein n=1 Tax=uncultured Coprobacter sp. TaxID=1720550 RepID=UPI0025E11545|nr:ATP-binding protein [uncultured Coprobacter sp.]